MFYTTVVSFRTQTIIDSDGRTVYHKASGEWVSNSLYFIHPADLLWNNSRIYWDLWNLSLAEILQRIV